MSSEDQDRPSPEWWVETVPRVRAFVQRRLRPGLAAREAPSDIVQSVCREVLADLQSAPESADATPALRWRLLRRALRKIVQKHRYHTADRRDSRRTLGGGALDGQLDPETGPLGRVVANERAQALAAAMQRLPEDYRRIIAWVHFEGLPHAETGRRLGRSEDASKMLLSRAMAKLAAELGSG